MAHTFDLTIRWKEGFRGAAELGGTAPSVPFSVPREFGGPGGEWTPEHFFTAAINCCIMATFVTMAQMSKLPIAAYEARATSTMDKTEAGLRMTRVVVETRIVVTAEKDRERALRLVEKAEKMCPISHSVTSEVVLKAMVEVA